MAAPPPRTPSRIPRRASMMIRASLVMVPRIGTSDGPPFDGHFDRHVRSRRHGNLHVLIRAAYRDAGVWSAEPIPAATGLHGLGLRCDERVCAPTDGQVLP